MTGPLTIVYNAKNAPSMINDDDLLDRDPGILGGKAVIKSTRISVAIVLEWIASGGTPVSISQRYPTISPKAVEQAILYGERQQ